MKSIFKTLVIGSIAILSASCVKETFPTSIATSDQLGASASALEAVVNSSPSQWVQGYLVYGEQEWEFDMAYPGMMIIMDSAAGEIIDSGETGYDWFSYWSSNNYQLGETVATAYVPWRTYYIFVKSANEVIGRINPETASEAQLQYLAKALCYRAFAYLNLARMYEYKAPTDPAVAGTYKPEADITGLTVPIVTEKTTLEESKNNPRATVEQIYELIFSDLGAAEKYLEGTASTSSLFPTLAVAYGLKARAYLERGSAGVSGAFASAAGYAKKALDAFGGSPLTQAQWEDPANGFNNASANSNSWMWYLQYDAETMGNLCNFVGQISNEQDWSYGSLYGPGIAKSLYDQIPDTDFRKHSWLDPEGDDYYLYKFALERGGDYDPYEFIAFGNFAYASIKFRPASGDYLTYSVGGVSQVPMMRMEEMMLIEAEALAMSGDLAGGKAVLNSLIQTRNPEYTCDNIPNAAQFQQEVYLQKRIELWGEGLIYYDAKRLGAGVCNGYVGTNTQSGYRLNCTGVAPWWNFVIPRSEISANPALKGFNNPDPTKSVKEWTE